MTEHRHLWLSEASTLAARLTEDSEQNCLPVLCDTCRDQITDILAINIRPRSRLPFYKEIMRIDAGNYRLGKRQLIPIMPYTRQEAGELVKILKKFGSKGLPKTTREKRMAISKFMQEQMIDMVRVEFAMEFFERHGIMEPDRVFLSEIETMLVALNGILGKFPVIGDEEFLEQYK
ncbi:hypothetical protein JXD20_04625 [Candidatus Peregrinibacteria bacterium]|nr:hypothetical protein [Candidatus Peregrinibacteria bacterium]